MNITDVILVSYYFVLEKLLLLCPLPRALPFHYFCATKRTVAVGPPGLFFERFLRRAGISPQLDSCPSLNCATESVRAFVLCSATHEKYILTLPKPLYAFMLSYSVCPPSLAVRLRPSERGLSFPDRRVFYGLCEGCRGARSCARREKEEGKAVISSLSVCL